MRHVRAIAVLAAAAAALAVPAAASADTNPTRVSAPSTASWVSSESDQRRGPRCRARKARSTASSPASCSSKVHSRRSTVHGFRERAVHREAPADRALDPAVLVPGWQLGDALLDVSACAFTCDEVARSIRIALRTRESAGPQSGPAGSGADGVRDVQARLA